MTEIFPTQKQIEEAIDRISRTPDGATLYVFLQRVLMSVPPTTKSGALRCLHGERSFAARLIGLMARGIAESVNRTSSGARAGTEQPVVLPTGRPVDTGRARGAGPRIGPDTRVPGWDRPDEE